MRRAQEITDAPPSRFGLWLEAHGLAAFGSLVFRYACFVAMTFLALSAEARPAPSLPDAVLTRVPYVPWVDRYNYVLWALIYVPVALALMVRDAPRFVRYMVSSGFLALLRGACIAVTGLGPVRGADVNAGMDRATFWRAFFDILSPVGVFERNSPHLYLTKDLFFSGHTGTTLLLLLYVWKDRPLRWLMLAGHVLVVASVFLSHLHYTIDVLGAYGITLALFFVREGDVAGALAGRRAG